MFESGAESDMALPSMEQRQFTLAEIRSATGEFSPDNRIGEGGFGEVFKAAIGDGTKLAAVKRLKRPAINERLARQGFAREIEALTQLRHRHIVSLIGCCSEQGEMILVYEYIANGTLEDHLHGKAKDRHLLTWTERLSICIGACRGLDYLHTSCPGNSIIHADVKSSNILLDENLVAKVSDFGSAKQINADVSESNSSTAEMYSRGYLDPLAAASGRFTMASDVYSFGVVMLEVVSERRADSRPQNDDLLSDWAVKKFRKGKGSELVASSLSGEISKQCRSCFLGIVERCLQREAEKRPTITEVLALLITALGLHLQQERPDPTRWFWQSKVSPKEVISSDLAQDNVIREDELEHLPVIPLAEFQDITGGFSSKFLIAKRSTGVSLFRGVLKTGQDAAIKRFKKKLSDQEFLAQVSKISRLQHKNVVQPLGYCVNGDQQLLAFEFAPYGSLHDIFHDKNLESSTVVPWVQRIKIAVGAAKGLEYIHENGLIHHSIKSSNILLFEDGNAKISDVSLSIPCPCKPARGHKRYPEQAPCGCCYHPPDVLTNRTQEGDVYSFGVVLLEILTGQKATQPLVQQFLAILHEATETPMQREEDIKKVVDDRLGFGRKCSASAVVMMAEVALSCLAKEADSRPDMSTVLIRLERASWETQIYVRKHEQQ